MNCASVLPKDHEITAENGSTESSSSTESSAHIDGASIDPPVTPTTPAPAPVSTATESKKQLRKLRMSHVISKKIRIITGRNVIKFKNCTLKIPKILLKLPESNVS